MNNIDLHVHIDGKLRIYFQLCDINVKVRNLFPLFYSVCKSPHGIICLKGRQRLIMKCEGGDWMC